MNDYTPIAKKKIDNDPENPEVERWIFITSNYNNALDKRITIGYNLVNVSGGKVVGVIKAGFYTRYNGQYNKKFDELFDSQVGQMIKGLIDIDLSEIESFDTLEQDLLQLDLEPED